MLRLAAVLALLVTGCSASTAPAESLLERDTRTPVYATPEHDAGDSHLCDAARRLDECAFLNPDGDDVALWGFDAECEGLPVKFGTVRGMWRVGCVPSGTGAMCCVN